MFPDRSASRRSIRSILGWFVIIVWECQLKKAVLSETIESVKAEILRNGEILREVQEDRRKAREAYRQEMRERK